ncbi:MULTISPECIES: hypothetical protein [Gemmobacter]|jgi:hypothetical protein|uniref:Uncharacterized protein n=2 Tax=Gemmobacter TaxID=204456 RepID=A0A2T6BBT7_9RHOB|nr:MULTISPECIES: hypothetical protein [Gemmobacter]OJY27452.1 MAG: hypothetical protein BGP11_15420 [Rhodobacterales bacterium 65-51]PTX53529.1 hypothetical protein C8N34_101447 [Gemmobacter caeni]TWJ05640.1 hypothetical protein IQ03_00445 [Gemmobacter caeni]GHC14863.1 hypothetical protein GCM10007291_10900 [Gemmobacter nanjingensis]
MRIAYHLGVHCTDDDRLVRTLHRNAGQLAAVGIEVPEPGRYRNLIRDAAIQLKGQPASMEMQANLLDQIMDADAADRLVLSWENFLSFPAWAVKGRFYHTGGDRMRTICQIFPEIGAEFHLGLRNPATYLPELHRRQRGRDYAEFIEGTDPLSLRWSDLILQLIDRNPGVPITVWADEDTPLIWPEVLQAVSGHPSGMYLEGADDLLGTVMTVDGMSRMAAYMEKHPPQGVAQRRRVVSAFLDKFARPDVVEMSFALPDWTDDMVAVMTETYDRDMAYIASLPGVTMITP